MTEQAIRRHALTFKEKLEVADFLKSVIETPDSAPAFYKSGWSDAAVAKRMKCTPGNVRGVRVYMYPSFIDKNKRDTPEKKVAFTKVTDLQAQVAHLQSRVKFLEEEFIVRLQYLEEGLGVTPPTKDR